MEETNSNPPSVSDPYPFITLEPTPPPPLITIEELLQLKEVIERKENQDRVVCGQINLPYDALRQKLLDWAIAGFPSAYEISRVQIEPPSKCSDGVTRNIYEYIQYLSNKSLDEHLQMIRDQVSGIRVSSTVQTNSWIIILVNQH